MGRTLHYTLRKETNLTEKEVQKIQKISERYNSGSYENIWSCENFYLDPAFFIPNVQNPVLRQESERQGVSLDEVVYQRFDHLLNEGYNQLQAKEKMIKEKFAVTFNRKRDIKKECAGFTKVQGNEMNAFLVLEALIDISKEVKKAEIHLEDEGKFLLCPIYIKNGKCFPDLDYFQEKKKFFSSKIVMSNGRYTNQMPEAKELSKDMQKEMGISFEENDAKMWINYMNDLLRDLKITEQRIKEKMNFSLPMFCFYNINNKKEDFNCWFNPFLFTRKVDMEQYKDYKMSPGTLMDGFDGEGFGLSDNDSEKSSYQMIAQIQKMVSGSGTEMHVLGEEE